MLSLTNIPLSLWKKFSYSEGDGVAGLLEENSVMLVLRVSTYVLMNNIRFKNAFALNVIDWMAGLLFVSSPSHVSVLKSTTLFLWSSGGMARSSNFLTLQWRLCDIVDKTGSFVNLFEIVSVSPS